MPGQVDRAALETELDAADRFLDELGPRIGPEHLTALVERSRARVFTGLHWLIITHGHTCQHLGEAQVSAHWLKGARGG